MPPTLALLLAMAVVSSASLGAMAPAPPPRRPVAAADSAGTTAPVADSTAHAAAPDSSRMPSAAPGDSLPREVRRFPPIEVAAGRIHDLRSNATVHMVTPEDLRDLPLTGFAQVLALQPGVVAMGDEIHVRGGRAGETQWTLNGLVMNEPFQDRAPEVPLFAIQRADLLAGGLDAEYAGALAGVVDLDTWNPTPRPSGAFRWLTTARQGTSFDWAGARGSTPLGVGGLGIVAAGETRLDDLYLPQRASRGRQEFLGRRFGWRNDNRMLGWAKLAPIESPQVFSIETIGSRTISQPYDPMISWDDSLLVYFLRVPCALCPPVKDSTMLFYRASDHQPMTETRRLTTTAQLSRLRDRSQWRLAASWQHGSELTSPGLAQDPKNLLSPEKLKFGQDMDPERDPFRAYQGEWAYFKRTRFDRFQAAASATLVQSPRSRTGFGAGVSWDDVELYELDAVDPGTKQVDSLRTFRTRAPGGWAYAQQRWEREGLVVNGGLRLQAFSTGDASVPERTISGLTLPAESSTGTHWTLSPRLGIVIPITVRDVLSASYARIHQPPGREYLADSRLLILTRRPLGQPALEPGELITYQAGLKHVFTPRWAAQGSFFQRDLYNQVGIVNDPYFLNTFRARYANSEYGHANGFEVALLGGPRATSAAATSTLQRFTSWLGSPELGLRYTWMTSRGTISDPEGWSYGPPIGARPLPIGEHPLDWDRGVIFSFDAVWRSSDSYSLAILSVMSGGVRWTPTLTYTDTPRGPIYSPDLAAVNSRQLPWIERTDVLLRLRPDALRGVHLLLEVRNLFDSRGESFASIAGFPNPTINTLRDDYAGYRTETGNGGGAYWDQAANGGAGAWIPVDDPRMQLPPRSIRIGLEAGL